MSSLYFCSSINLVLQLLLISCNSSSVKSWCIVRPSYGELVNYCDENGTGCIGIERLTTDVGSGEDVFRQIVIPLSFEVLE